MEVIKEFGAQAMTLRCQLRATEVMDDCNSILAAVIILG